MSTGQHSATPLSRRGFLTGAAGVSSMAVLGAMGVKSGITPSILSDLRHGSRNPLAQRHKVLLSYFTLNNAYYHYTNASAVAAMSALNLQRFTDVSTSDSDQLSQFVAAKAQGIQGISVIAADNAIEPALVRAAQKEKIYVVENFNSAPWVTPLDVGDYYYMFAVVQGIDTFRSVADLLFEKLGGKGKVIQIDGIEGASINTERLEGVAQAAKKYPNIEIVATRPGGWSRDIARPVIEALLTQYPDVNGIISHNDDMTVAIVDALRQHHLDKKVVIVSGDGIPEVLQLIESGDVYSTLATHPSWQGGYLVSRIFDAINGVKPSPAERMMLWGSFNINTPAAARAYMNVMYSHTPPYNWHLMSKALNPTSWNPGNLLVPLDPRQYWTGQEAAKPKGYKLPAAYDGAAWEQDISKTKALYAAHFSSDPLKKVRSLCTGLGGQVII